MKRVMKFNMNLMATGITGCTLLGVLGKPPYSAGNCFRVKADDGNEYDIVNFVYENLRAALDAKKLNWPIRIRVISGRVAVMHDERIPDNWYKSRFCEVCCPRNLLPLPQILAIERSIDQGRRQDGNGFTIIKHISGPRWDDL